jgi:hypothetical protein
MAREVEAEETREAFDRAFDGLAKTTQVSSSSDSCITGSAPPTLGMGFGALIV